MTNSESVNKPEMLLVDKSMVCILLKNLKKSTPHILRDGEFL